jgi:hypothetical protein
MLAAIIAVFSYIWFGGTSLKRRSAVNHMVSVPRLDNFFLVCNGGCLNR